MQDLIILGQAFLQVINNFKLVFILLPFALIILNRLEAENDQERT